MSHLPEREEKVCLNCNAALEGRFCHICGQENIQPRESFWDMLTHFVFDLFHFDGKFFSTLNYLLFKPGFLSSEHLRGRRASYLHPIRMYVFTSAFFFLIFFNFFQNEQKLINLKESNTLVADDIKELNTKKVQLQKSKVVLDKILAKQQSDSLQIMINQIDNDLLILQRDSTMKGKLKSLEQNDLETVTINGEKMTYKTMAQYDSLQSLLPSDKKSGYMSSKFKRQWLFLNDKYNGDIKAIQQVLTQKFLHAVPSLLFTSLPLFALVLFLLYSRRKTYFYSDHVIYTLHIYCAFFIFIFTSLVLSKAVSFISKPISEWVSGIVTLVLSFYWYKSIRYFYAQSRTKTILKFIVLLFLNLLLLMILFIVFFLFSAMTIH